MRKRHPDNSKLRLNYNQHYSGRYRVYPIMYREGQPLIENYLEALERVLWKAYSSNRRTLAVRIDLRYPDRMFLSQEQVQTNQHMTHFFRYLKRELDQSGTKYPAELRYAWAREQQGSRKPHYHLLLLLNYDAICSIGNLTPSFQGGYQGDNLFHRIARAWARALNLADVEVQGLIQVAQDPFTRTLFCKCLRHGDESALNDIFWVGSYLCKAYSKTFSRGFISFTTSH